MIPKREKTTEIASDVAQGEMLHKRVIKWADEASQRFMEGEGLNDAIANIARRENLNRLQLQRLIEESNTVAYNKKYGELRSGNDRRISFPLAELGHIIEILGEDAPKDVENPNWIRGKSGAGTIEKSASASELSYIHNPHRLAGQRHDQQMEKQASLGKVKKDQQLGRLQTELQSGIFKVANALVMTEKRYKTANQLFNTVLDSVPLPNDLIEGIQKRARDISERLIARKLAIPSFSVELKVEPTEKVASLLLGEHSLIKHADTTMIEPPKVAPTSDIASYQQLIDLAKQIHAQHQEMSGLPHETGTEVQ